ncbi:MAG TPA: MFS transporter [Gemmataceae bacterium]|nr:MFS transporter [Gemmataceae bacterium]
MGAGMFFETAGSDRRERPWWRSLSRYQWLVFAIASLGWLFDCMDQQIFNLARAPALKELLASPQGTLGNDTSVVKYGGYATSLFLIGWAIGGVIFGILGDRLGRSKTMVLTILIYSLFRGCSAFSIGVLDFAAWRFLTGLGGGGQFAVGVALVAEVMPDRARPHALAWLQTLGLVGNMLAAGIDIGLGQLKTACLIGSTWRPMFFIGVLPALVALLVVRRLQESERWSAAVAESGREKLGSLNELFGDPRWRRHTLVGMCMAFAGVVGLWAIGFFSFDLIHSIFGKTFARQGLPEEVVEGKVGLWMGIASLLINLGGSFGCYAFSRVTQHIGRRPAFALAFTAALLSTVFTFWFLQTPGDVLWMIPLMGSCQLALFGGYTIYFPELFPTRLRSTGTSFCYNVGRLAAAIGPVCLSLLTSRVFVHYTEPLRYAGVAMCAVFLIGLLALPFAPETKGLPLPE